MISPIPLSLEQSRRDDLEALGHVFMYFLRGQLPWQGLKAATNKQKYEKIGEKKQSTAVKDLCQGFPGKCRPYAVKSCYLAHMLTYDCDLSEEFGIYLQYVRKLGFEELPDYNFLQELFNKVLRNGGHTDDTIYDWKLLNDGKGWEVSSIFQLIISSASCKYWFDLWCICVFSPFISNTMRSANGSLIF
jgi:casein kinase 1